MFYNLLSKSFLLLSLAVPSWGQTRTIQEGVPSQKNAILVSTTNARVLFSTRTYAGGIPNTAIYSSSNAVFSAYSNSNAIVLYSTGSVYISGNLIVAGTSTLFITSGTTFSGDSIFSNIRLSTYSGSIELNQRTALESGDIGPIVWAMSIDGATQSSGCIVAVNTNSNLDTATLVFTSTTSGITIYQAGVGVLMESCAPSSICKIGMSTNRPYRFQADSSGVGSGNTFRFSSTRCRVTDYPGFDSNTRGGHMFPDTILANQWFWGRLIQ